MLLSLFATYNVPTRWSETSAVLLPKPLLTCTRNLAPLCVSSTWPRVVQMLYSTIHWISIMGTNCVIQWIVLCQVDSVKSTSVWTSGAKWIKILLGGGEGSTAMDRYPIHGGRIELFTTWLMHADLTYPPNAIHPKTIA